MKETERKFLVSGPFPMEGMAYKDITQGYLCSHINHVVRVRIENEKAFLTVKGPNRDGGFSHLEIEKELTLEEGLAMMELCEPGIIRKRRYLVPCDDGSHMFEVDVFEGKNSGLVLAEIELESEDEPFIQPEWLGVEVTYDYRYMNSELRKVEM